MLNTPNSASSSRRTPGTPGEPCCIISVIENRAREVGLACVNLNSFKLSFTQFVDYPTYVNTVSTLFAWDPYEVLLPKTAENSLLKTRILQHLKGISIEYIPRNFYDERHGQELYKNSVLKVNDVETESKYIGLAALSSLIQYLQNTQHIIFYDNCLHITYSHLENLLLIDYSTARTLEIIVSNQGSIKHSLAGCFVCRTIAGFRMLRANLLQPSREHKTITERQKAVKELIECSSLRSEVSSVLSQLPNTELITARLIQKQKSNKLNFAKLQVQNIVAILQSLEAAQCINQTLCSYSFSSREILEVIESIDDRRIDSLIESFQFFLNLESVKGTSVSKEKMLHLVKEGISGLLDISREIHKNILDEVNEYFNQVKYSLNHPGLKLQKNSARKFFLQFDSLNQVKEVLGEPLIKVSVKSKKVVASTPKLTSLNEKLSSSENDIIALTYEVLEELLLKAREKIICLYNISHSIGVLDELLAFAEFSIQYECVKPEFTSHNLTIHRAKNPILENFKAYMPSNYQILPNCLFQVVTGVNSSGKTTYLKTLAIVQVLAQTGCFVPACSASLVILDALLVRLGETESIEYNASSFLAEMQDSHFILNTATKNSLVLVDELGRGTSHEDGVSLAWAIAESFILKEARCLFSTHFHQLTGLESIYPTVKNKSLENFKVLEGRLENYYALELSQLSFFPLELVQDAKRLLGVISEKFSYLSVEAKRFVCSQKASMQVVKDLTTLDTCLSPKSLQKQILSIKQ